MSVYLLPALNFTGLMALMAVCFGLILRSDLQPHIQKIALGVVLGFGACAASLQPVMIVNGLQIDPRNLFVGCAGAFAGPLAGAISFVMAAFTRYYEGQPSTEVCVLSLLVATCAGLAWRHATRNRARPSQALFLGLGLTISLSYVCTFLLARSNWAMIFSTAIPFLTIVNIIGSIVLGGFLERERRRAIQWRQLHDQASVDPLTGLMNRRYFEVEYLASSRSAASDGMACLLIDLDHFKKVNDIFGHSVGDSVLVAVADCLRRNLRGCDLIARFGGEEFAVHLPATDAQQSHRIAQDIRKAISEIRATDLPAELTISASIGVFWCATPSDLQIAFEMADKALYQAKVEGRNRVVFNAAPDWSPTSDTPPLLTFSTQG